MDKPMTASEKSITDGQIENLVDKFRAALRKHRTEIPSEVAQQVLGIESIGRDMYSIVRTRVEALSTMVVRTASVDRSRTPQQVLAATNRKQYVTDSAVASLPRGTSETAETVFFKLNLKSGWISDEDLDKEYSSRGLEPEYPDSLAAINEADPSFADDRPNCTHWKDAGGKWCYAAFDRWDDERDVGVYRDGHGWNDGWWFAGRRKST